MKKNSKALIVRIFALVAVIFLSHCASRKTPPPAAPRAATIQGWDYDKIRQVRANEQAAAPTDPVVSHEAKLSDQCKVMSADAVTQGKIPGCKKLDPRLGFGDDHYCCPRSDLK